MSIEMFYIFIAFNLILVYFIIVTIFGFFFLTLIDKESLNNKISLTLILKSFAIGLALHICYSMLVITFRIFNFFIILLPFIIFDIFFLICLYKKNDNVQKRIKNSKIKTVLNNIKKKKDYLLIITIILLLQYILQFYFLNRSLQIAGKDGYHWFAHTWFVHENGYLDYTSTYSRPPGYILVVASITCYIDDFYVFYYLFKYFPVCLMSINILTFFIITKKFFKEKSYIFITLVVFLSFEYFFYRTLVPFVSILATTFGFLFLLFLDKSALEKCLEVEDSKLIPFAKQQIFSKESLFKGLILAVIFMIHPLYIAYYLICFLAYELVLFLINLFQERRPFSQKFHLTLKFLIINFSIILFLTIFILPNVICIASYAKYGFRTYIKEFFKRFLSTSNNYWNKNILLFIGSFFKEIGEFLIENPIYQGLDNIIRSDLFTYLGLEVVIKFYQATVSIGIFFIVLAIFLKLGKNFKFNQEQKYFINFIKFSFVFTFFIFVFTGIIGQIEFPFTQDLFEFLDKFKFRLLELFQRYGQFY